MNRRTLVKMIGVLPLAQTALLGCGPPELADGHAYEHEHANESAPHGWSATNPHMIHQLETGFWHSHLFPCESFETEDALRQAIDEGQGVLFL